MTQRAQTAPPKKRRTKEPKTRTDRKAPQRPGSWRSSTRATQSSPEARRSSGRRASSSRSNQRTSPNRTTSPRISSQTISAGHPSPWPGRTSTRSLVPWSWRRATPRCPKRRGCGARSERGRWPRSAWKRRQQRTWGISPCFPPVRRSWSCNTPKTALSLISCSTTSSSRNRKRADTTSARQRRTRRRTPARGAAPRATRQSALTQAVSASATRSRITAGATMRALASTPSSSMQARIRRTRRTNSSSAS